MLSPRQALAESERCLTCFEAPCAAACPAHIDVPTFVSMIRTGNLRGAAETVRRANALANVCGSVCPQEVFCQPACTRGRQDTPIDIRGLHLFATQQERILGAARPALPPPSGGSAAVVGAGPAGLACGFELLKLGHPVRLFDRELPGGVPRLSIPSFRLPHDVLQSDVGFLLPLLGFTAGEIDAGRFREIRSEHRAVFVGIGLGKDKPLPLPGSHLRGVVPVLEFLEAAKAGAAGVPAGARVVVVGGGNVSLDAAATARRAGASEVLLLYRRGEQEMRVWRSELQEARRLGVEMRFLTTPVGLLGERSVEGVLCRRTGLTSEVDATGRPVPEEIGGSDFTVDARMVIVAIGQVPRADFLESLARTPQGYLRVGEDLRTSEPGVFAGGDIVGGEGTVVQSVAQGARAAHAMHAYLSGA